VGSVLYFGCQVPAQPIFSLSGPSGVARTSAEDYAAAAALGDLSRMLASLGREDHVPKLLDGRAAHAQGSFESKPREDPRLERR
jgi:hypothetical protein